MKSLKQLAFLILSLLFIVSCDDDDPTTLTSDPTENAANKQPLGTSANELLSSDEFTSLRVEIAYPEGFRPTDSTIELLIPFLEERLNKPDGITLVESTITTNTEGPYDINDIVAIEDANRSVFNNGDEMGVWLFFSDQSSEGDSDSSVVLGTAYRNTSMVIYEKTFLELANNSTTAISRTLIETSTIRHEFGHIFGLVNGGTPLTSDHHDEENGRHCNVEDCLMYFQTVTTIFNTSNTASLPNFDALCIQDLQANGGL
jgi:hypothetical protein